MRRSCARATLAAFFVWWELLGAQPLMPDFLGSVGGAEEQGESIDYLGRQVPTAFKSTPALPAGGGAPGAAAAPATVAGTGTVVGPGVTGGGGGGGGAAGPTTLAQIAQALGLSEQALRASPWARRLFAEDSTQQAGAPGTPSQAITAADIQRAFASEFPGEAMGEPSTSVAFPDLRFPQSTGEEFALPSAAIQGTGADPGILLDAPGLFEGSTGLGLAGAALTVAGQATGNKDVSRSGQAASGVGTAGSLVGSTVGGAGAPFALPALGYTGMNIADQVETDARIKRDVANAKNVLGAKVPSAVSRLGKTLNDLSSLDPASATTEQLLAAQNELQMARTEFNAVDHAFKGVLSIAGKPVDTGLSLDMVKPQLDALNESQLRIQDALESRGIQSGQIPGYQSPQDWLNFLDSPLYQQYTTGTPRFSEGVEFEPADLQNPEIAAALKGIQPGQTESGLRQLIGRGLPARVPRPSPESLVGRAFGGGEDFAPAASAMDAP